MEELQQQKKNYKKCVPDIERGKGPDDKIYGKSQST